MSVSADLLRDIPFLRGLDDRAIEEVASSMRERRVPAGQEVVRQGESGVGFFIVLDGEAEVGIDGQTRRTLGRGDHFGEIALVARDSPRTATVTARTDLQLAGMTPWVFKPLAFKHPEVMWALLETLAQRVSETPGR